MNDDDDDASRRFDELECIAAVYPSEYTLLSSPDDIKALGRGEPKPVDFQLTFPMTPSNSGVLVLNVTLPVGYPSKVAVYTVCRVDVLAKEQLEALNRSVISAIVELGVGTEAVVDVASTAVALAKAAVAMTTQEEAIIAGGDVDSAGTQEWRRVFYLANHLLEGKTHKKEVKLKQLATGAGLTGMMFFGTPGVVVCEGPQTDQDAFERASRQAGKPLKPRKSQSMHGGGNDRLYPKFGTTAAVGGKGSLDIAAIEELLIRLGLESKLKHIIGVEDLKG